MLRTDLIHNTWDVQIICDLCGTSQTYPKAEAAFEAGWRGIGAFRGKGWHVPRHACPRCVEKRKESNVSRTD